MERGVEYLNPDEIAVLNANAKTRLDVGEPIERLGARLDGVLRGDRLERNGVLRDTVVYSVLEHEWPSVRTGLEARVARR